MKCCFDGRLPFGILLLLCFLFSHAECSVFAFSKSFTNSSSLAPISETEELQEDLLSKQNPRTQKKKKRASTDKRYDKDELKRKARALLKKQIQRILLTKNPAQGLKVLHFPGQNAMETTEVYLSLGFSPKNIVGVEQDKQIAELIENKNLGIQLKTATLSEYVDSQSSLDFDVISLDYTGTMKESDLETLSEIFKKNRKKDFLVHVAHVAYRDSRSKELYNRSAVIAEAAPHHNDMPSYLATMIESSMNNLDREEFDIREKVNALNDHVRLAHLSLRHDEQVKRSIRLLERIGHTERFGLTFLIPGSLNHQLLMETLKLKRANGGQSAVDYVDTVFAYLSPLIQAKLMPYLHGVLKAENFKKGSKRIIYECFRHLVGQTMRFENQADYYYISDTGAPMIGTIMEFRETALGSTFTEFLEPFLQKEFHGKRNIRDRHIQRPLRKLAQKINSEMALDDPREFHHFVKDSSKPQLTKAKANALFRKNPNLTREELATQFDISPRLWKRLPAYKAWVTMRMQA